MYLNIHLNCLPSKYFGSSPWCGGIPEGHAKALLISRSCQKGNDVFLYRLFYKSVIQSLYVGYELGDLKFGVRFIFGTDFLHHRIHIGCGVDPNNLMFTSSPFRGSKTAGV